MAEPIEEPDLNMNTEGTGDPFNAPVAGQSLTEEPNQNPMEKPPRYTDPKEVYMKLVEKFSQPDIQERTLEMLSVGIPVEVFINTIVKHAAYTGSITPDVAELLKPALTVFFIDMAKQAGIDVIIFSNDPTEEQEKELEKNEMLVETLKSQRPEMVANDNAMRFREELGMRAKEASDTVNAREEIGRRSEEMDVESDGSFIDMGEV